MYLKLNQIQVLDFILKKLQGKYLNFLKSDEKLKLVVKINNNLWTGNFVNYSGRYIENLSIDFDNQLSESYIDFYNIFDRNIFSEFNLNTKFKNITSPTLYLLLEELIKVIKDLDCSKLITPSILFDSVNLDTNLTLPFIFLNDVEYDVVSIITTTKN